MFRSWTKILDLSLKRILYIGRNPDPLSKLLVHLSIQPIICWHLTHALNALTEKNKRTLSVNPLSSTLNTINLFSTSLNFSLSSYTYFWVLCKISYLSLVLHLSSYFFSCCKFYPNLKASQDLNWQERTKRWRFK